MTNWLQIIHPNLMGVRIGIPVFTLISFFSSFHGGDWEVWLELHTRYDVEDNQEIDYALAITIEDLTQSLNLYDSVLNEAQNRFPAVQLVRLPIRT